jgi:acyl-homoserine lactone acylase PvdQ
VSRPLRVLLLLAALACAATPAAASARVFQATSILPPGESGYVSIAGLANGSGSPHLYDQQQPYIDFQRKDAMLGQPGVSSEQPMPGVRIVRDAYGVPSIYGQSTYGLWWGAGYATAEDRLFELEVFRAVGRGTLASLVGPSELPMDIVDRRDFYTNAELAQMLARLPVAMQQRYAAYAAGINAYVDYLTAHPTMIPGEFLALGVTPTHFSVQDLASIGVYLARVTPNGDGSELTNMQAIQESGPAKFNRILPLRINGQVSTIPRSDGLFPSVPGRTQTDQRIALQRSYRFVRHLPLPAACNQGWEYVSGTLPSGVDSCTGTQARGRGGSRVAAGEAPASGAEPTGLFAPAAAAARREVQQMVAPIHVGGSYMVAVSDPREHRAVLFNGPELGYLAPEELYEMELHGPGIDVRGITAPGAPVIAIGHNQHVTFGLTSGLGQTNALYVERLVPGHPEEYYYRGQILQMSCRDETFQYRSEPTSLLNPTGILHSPPQLGSVTLRLCRTNEGPVQERVGGYVYSRRYATWMREMQTLTGLAAVDSAASVAQVNRALAGVTWNENMMAADDHGNIGYWYPGLNPIRPKRWDERLPYPGDGRAQWQGFLPVSERPHVIDPAQHFLTNWNTLPSQGWTTGNDPAPERVAGPFFRGAYLQRLASRLVHDPTFDGMEALIRRAGTVAQQRPLDSARLRRALHGSHGGARTVLQTILDWNGNYASEEANGTVDPGVATWQTFKDQLQAIAITPLGAAGQLIGSGEPNSEHLFDVSLGQAYALRVLGPAGYREAAARTYTALVRRFGTRDPASWRQARTYAPETALGAEQPPPMPFFDRGTFEEVTSLGR